MSTKKKSPNKIRALVITTVITATIALIFSIFGDFLKDTLFQKRDVVTIKKTVTVFDTIHNCNITTTYEYQVPIVKSSKKTRRVKTGDPEIDPYLNFIRIPDSIAMRDSILRRDSVLMNRKDTTKK